MIETIFRRAALVLLVAAAPVAAQKPGWTGSAQIDGNVLFGAAHARVIGVALGIGRGDSTLSAHADYRFGYADDRQSDHVRRTTARAMKLSLSTDLHPYSRWSPFWFGSGESSLQQRVASRFDGGVGAKYTIQRHDRNEASVSLAVLAERTHALPAPDVPDDDGAISSRARWSLRVRLQHQMTSSLFLSHTTFYQPAMSAFQHFTTDSKTTLENKLLASLSLTATLRDLYDSEATRRGATSNHDGQFLLGVRAAF